MLTRYTDRRGLRIWLVGIAVSFIVLGTTNSLPLAILPFVAAVLVARGDRWLRERRETRRAAEQDSLHSRE